MVDDDQSVREGLSSLIRSTGLHVEAFQSAADFLEFQRPDTPACLVLDVRMPQLSGMDLQRKLADAADETHVLMNNCYANYGATNARELARLLADLKPA